MRLRFGVIGAGNIGNVHLRGLSKFPEVEVVGVTDAHRPLAERRAEEYGIRRVYDTADELIACDDIDAVVVGVPNKYHGPIAVRALEAGKHLLLEKPMAIDIDDARAIVRAQRDSGKVAMIAHQMRWGSVAQEVKAQIDKGALGRIYHAKAGWFRRKGIPGWGTWFTTKSESGGGPLIDIGVHLLDLSLYLMGSPKPVSVFGSTYAEFGPKRKGIGTWGTPNWNGVYDVEDLATALIKMEDGSSLTLEVSWAVNADIEGGGPFVHLMGSEGGATIRGASGKIYTEVFDRTVDLDIAARSDDEGDRTRMVRHFLDCIVSGKSPISSVMTGFANNLILDAIYRSSTEGREIILDWDV